MRQNEFLWEEEETIATMKLFLLKRMWKHACKSDLHMWTTLAFVSVSSLFCSQLSWPFPLDNPRPSPMTVVGLEFSLPAPLRSVLDSILLHIAIVETQRFIIITSKHAFWAGSRSVDPAHRRCLRSLTTSELSHVLLSHATMMKVKAWGRNQLDLVHQFIRGTRIWNLICSARASPLSSQPSLCSVRTLDCVCVFCSHWLLLCTPACHWNCGAPSHLCCWSASVSTGCATTSHWRCAALLLLFFCTRCVLVLVSGSHGLPVPCMCQPCSFRCFFCTCGRHVPAVVPPHHFMVSSVTSEVQFVQAAPTYFWGNPESRLAWTGLWKIAQTWEDLKWPWILMHFWCSGSTALGISNYLYLNWNVS